MPELPEVECLSRAVATLVAGGTMTKATFLRKNLRDAIPIPDFREILVGQPVVQVFRRSKYLLMRTPKGFGVFHLGMSGNMLHFSVRKPQLPHTHAVFEFTAAGGTAFLHFVDPRRFGRISAIAGATFKDHPFFAELGPEPLDLECDLGLVLYQRSRGRRAPVKTFIMDAHHVVGVGNIYASEALFRAGVDPLTPVSSLTKGDFARIAEAIRNTLNLAIAAGGTTFRDYRNADGNPGYFKVSLNVYEREGEPCLKCGQKIEHVRLAGRATYFCSTCQKR